MFFPSVMEIVGKDWRVFAGLMVHFSFGIGYMFMGGVAYAFKDSFKFELFVLSPALLFPLAYL